MPLKTSRNPLKSKVALTLALVPAMLLTRPGFAQEAVPAAPQPPANAPDAPDSKTPDTPDAAKETPTQTLEDAMKEAKLSRPIIVMAVGADRIEGEKPKKDAIEKLAAHYGLSQYQPDWVLAFGPKEMTVLETNLGKPNPYDDVPPNEAMTLLMSMLTDAQLGKLTGKDGLGLSDLTDDMQQHLYQLMMPSDDDCNFLFSQDGENVNANPLDIMATKSLGAKLRIKQHVGFGVFKQNDSIGVGIDDHKNYVAHTYLWDGFNSYDNLDKLNGVTVHQNVPNSPKPGKLNFNDPALQIAINPDGVKTVGELMERIAKATKLELYADLYYETRKLTLCLGRKTVRAADLLRSLAFCVGGTYRQVGPAYILTDDIKGAGTRRQIIQDYEQECSAMRYPLLKHAEEALYNNATLQNTKFANADESLVSTPEEEKAGKKSQEDTGAMSAFKLPFEQLTPEQQKFVREYADVLEKYAEEFPENGYRTLDLTKDINVWHNPVVELTLPGLSKPIDPGFGIKIAGLFRKTPQKPTFDQEKYKKRLFAQNNEALWRDAHRKFARRGWLARPRSRDAVDAALNSMKKLGLNELWMVVFEDGKSLIPNTFFPIVASLRDADDLLTYAIEKAKAQNVKVCPVMELFSWDKETPEEQRDRTIRGEDSEEDMVRRDRVRKEKAGDDGKKKPEHPKYTVWVNSYDLEVQKKLRGLMKAVALHTGVGDWVWNNAVPPGYINTTYSIWDKTPIMGYNETARLNLIREVHHDMVDFQPRFIDDTVSRVNLSLPNYDYSYVQGGLSQEDVQKWYDVQEKLLRKTLTSLYKDTIAELPEKDRPNLFLMQRDKAMRPLWYDQWTPTMQDAPVFTAQTTAVVPDIAPVAGQDKPAAPPKIPSGCFHLLVPHAYGPIVVKEEEIKKVLGFQIQQMNSLNIRQWDSLVLEEGDFDFDF